jgi:hypothetical protein
MSDPIITVENLGKRYSLRHQTERYTALRDVIARRATAPLRALKSKLESRKEKTGNGAGNLTSRRGVGPSGPEADLGPLPAAPKPGEGGTLSSIPIENCARLSNFHLSFFIYDWVCVPIQLVG